MEKIRIKSSLILKKLNKQLKIVIRSRLYKDKKLPNRINSFKEFEKLPFTTKNDLRKYLPYGYLSVPLYKIVEMHSTSGTTGLPTAGFYTEKDLKISKTMISKGWKEFGVGPKSRVLFCMKYGMFSGAPLNTYAIQYLGGFVIPAGIGSIEYFRELIELFKPNTIVGTPYFVKSLGVQLSTKHKRNIKTVIVAGEPCPSTLKERISRIYFNARIFEHYGLCEIDTGIAYECREKSGLHVITDYVYPEIIDPLTKKLLPRNTLGELVLTHLEREASPLIRYRTGDITSLKSFKCKCGSKYPLIDYIIKRKDETLFYKGVKIDVAEVAEVISKIKELSGDFQFVVSKNLFKEKKKPLKIIVEKSNRKVLKKKEIIESLRKFIRIPNLVVEIKDLGFFNRFSNLKIKRIKYE